MSGDMIDEQKKKAIGFGTITFLIGIVIASITMFTFMESRIAKAVQESMRLAQLEQMVKSDREVSKERHKSTNDKIWTNEQNLNRTLLDINNKMNSLEAKVISMLSSPNLGNLPQAPPNGQ
jgi:septation ring formation regulator EzrA